MADNTIKKRHVFNWVDLLILLLIAALALMVFLSFVPDDSLSGYGGKKVELEFVIQIDKLSNDIELNMNVNDSVTDMESKEKLGVLSESVMVVAYQENVFNENGEAMEIVNSETHSTVYLTVKAEAVETQNGYYVNNVRVAVGKEYSLRIAGLEATGSCISILVGGEQ